MPTLIIVILLALMCYFALFHSKKVCVMIGLLTLSSFIFVGNGFFSSLLLKPLQNYPILHNPDWTNKNAIVVLGGGAIKYSHKENDIVLPTIMSYPRILEAARLYFSCKKTAPECKVVVSGGDSLKTGKSEAEVFRDKLVSLGIAGSDIEVEPNSMNTFKNAEYTSVFLKREQYERVFLVTSGIHLNRSLLYFSHFDVHAIPAPSDYISAKISLIPSGQNFAMADFAMHEYAGIIRFHVYNFFGWNTSVSKPGAL